MIDGILSMPFRYPLLRQLSRTDSMVMSAILYAFRFHQDTNKFFYLTDAKIAEWTGFKRTAIYEARRRLELDGWIVVKRGHGGYNMYKVTDSAIARLEAIEGQSQKEQRERLRQNAEKAIQDLKVEQAIARILLAFILRTGRMPSKKSLRRWVVAARKLHDRGYTDTTIEPLVKDGDYSLFALLKRVEQDGGAAKAPKKHIEYDVINDPELGWIAIPREVIPEAAPHEVVYE